MAHTNWAASWQAEQDEREEIRWHEDLVQSIEKNDLSKINRLVEQGDLNCYDFSDFMCYDIVKQFLANL